MEENNYTEEDMKERVKLVTMLSPAASDSMKLSHIAEAVTELGVLLAQISESLAILVNNTRLIRRKEAKGVMNEGNDENL